jgi:hypothetical protein
MVVNLLVSKLHVFCRCDMKGSRTARVRDLLTDGARSRREFAGALTGF